MNYPFEILDKKLDKVLASNAKVLKAISRDPKTEDSDEGKPMTFKEACEYVNLSETYMRLLCHKKEVPFHKPPGRRQLQFFKHELNDWMVSGGKSETEAEALKRTYL